LISLRALDVSRKGLDWRMMDFRNQVYYPAKAFREGNNPYDASAFRQRYPTTRRFAPYLPHTLVIHLPWSALPFATAERVYFLWTLGLYVVVAALTVSMSGLPMTAMSVFGLATLVLISRPAHNNLLLGQLGAELAVATLASIAFARSRPWLSSLCLVAALAKPTYGVPLAAMMLVGGDVRVVARATLVTGTLCAFVASVLAWNAGGIASLLHTVYEGGSRYGRMLGEPQDLISRSDIPTLIGRLLWIRIDWNMQILIALAVVGVACAALAKLRRVAGDREKVLSTSVMCLALVLCSYHQAYDLIVLMVIPVMLLATKAPSALPVRASRWAIAALVSVPLVNYLASYHAIDYLGLTGWSVRIIGMLNAACLSAAFAIALAAIVRLHPTSQDAADTVPTAPLS
jgi:hypothetical protein